MAERDLQKEFDSLKKDIEKLQKDFSRLSENGGSIAGDALSGAKEKLDAEAQKIIASLHEASTGIQDHGKKYYNDFEKQIEEKPVSFLVTSLGIGVVLGWLMGRK